MQRTEIARHAVSDRERLLDRLAHLRGSVRVFSHELPSARRQSALLHAENGWLLEQVRQLQRGLVQSNPSVTRPPGKSTRYQ